MACLFHKWDGCKCRKCGRRRKERRSGICLALMAALCMMLISGCGDAHAREYRRLLREREKIRDKAVYSDSYDNYYDEKYAEILSGMEAMPGYRDADALADEARAFFYEEALQFLRGDSDKVWYAPYAFDKVTRRAEQIGSFRDMADWQRLNEAAQLMREGHAADAEMLAETLPAAFDDNPLRCALRIGASCAAEDWFGALEQLDAYLELGVDESVFGADVESLSASTNAYIRERKLEKIRNMRLRTLSSLLESPRLGISYQESHGYVGSGTTEKLYHDILDAILQPYCRQAFEAGLNLRTLERYPYEGLQDYMIEELEQRTECLRQELTEEEILARCEPHNNDPTPVDGNGFCVIFTKSGSDTILLNRGEEAMAVFAALPQRSLWAQSAQELHYVVQFIEKSTATHTVRTTDTGTGRQWEGHEYDIDTRVVVRDTVTGSILRTFEYHISQHNHTSTRQYVMENEILPALQKLIGGEDN